MLTRFFSCFVTVYLLSCASQKETLDSPTPTIKPPNILWITSEDISPNLGCYGDIYAKTPHLDQLAKEGVLYKNAFASAPVCAVARSSIISGLYASSQGTQHMRCRGKRPKDMKLYPELLREAGYYCTNNAKTDYNLDMDHKSIWDGCHSKAHWRDRAETTQPFFSIFNLGTSHESRVNGDANYERAIQNLSQTQLTESGKVPLPPYFPDTEKVRQLWARYYSIITAMDQQVGELLQQLEDDGLSENTIIIFYSDHGAGIPRHKRWMYDTGLRVPLLVKAPDKYKSWLPLSANSTTDELVSFIDLAPTAIHLAGIQVPDYMEGRAFIGKNLTPKRDYVYAGRDRMDERYDMQRSVRDERYLYIRYYEPYKSFCQYMNTPEKGAIMQAIRQAQASNSLSISGQRLVASTKPNEELFDCISDPYNLHNLADDPSFTNKLEELRRAHAQWSDDTKDTGLIPETILRSWEAQQDASIYNIMRTQDIPVTEIRQTALDELGIEELINNLAHENEAVRYWAAISLGNQVEQLNEFEPLEAVLRDSIPAVRFAAARAYIKASKVDQGLAVLTDGLRHDDEWVRLLAAQILDESGENSRPAVAALQSVMEDDNKYVVRVANHALNELLETSVEVR